MLGADRDHNENYIERLNDNTANSSSTKTNSDKKENTNNSTIKQKNRNKGFQTPKFGDKDKVSKFNEEKKDETVEQVSFPIILKKIEEAKKLHSFAPTNDVMNIFNNTVEIVHRKFFEICFDEFLGKIFSSEKDQNNLIRLDSLYNHFIYLRGLKNLLFTDKNKIHFSNVFFYDE
jgi:hypothetical protein